MERDAIDYESFRQRLIAAIAEWEASGEPPEEWSYYRCWARALESLLVDRSALGSSELETRVAALAERPHGHDHHE